MQDKADSRTDTVVQICCCRRIDRWRCREGATLLFYSADSVYHTFMKGCNVFDRETLLSTYSTTFCYCSPHVQLQFGLQNVALIHHLT